MEDKWNAKTTKWNARQLDGTEDKTDARLSLLPTLVLPINPITLAGFDPPTTSTMSLLRIIMTQSSPRIGYA